MRFPKHRRTTGSLALTALVTAASAATLAPPAQAGDYTVSYCRDVNNKPVNLYDWNRFGASTAFGVAVTEGCKANYSPMAVAFINNQSLASGTYTGWELVADGGLKIVGHKASGTWHLGPGTYASAGWAGYCNAANVNCNNAAWSGQRFDAGINDARPAIQFLLSCQPGGGATCDGDSDVQILDNDVTFRDPTPPAGPAPSGPLLGSSAGNPVSGTVAVTANATDSGSGVRQVQAIVDGQVVAATSPQCDAPYERMHPCPSRSTAPTFSVDTTQVPDGTHALQIVAVDASGERALLHDGQIIVGNSPTRGPGSDVNVRGAQNGSYGADDVKITAWWTATARKPTSNKRIQAKCKKSKSYHRSHKVLCDGRPASRQLSTAFSSKKLNVIRGRAVAANGQPVAGATLQLVAAPSATGAAPSIVATPVTDGTGRFVVRVPVASGSASYAVQWVARARDTTPAAAVTMRRKVKSATTFTASPRRTVRRGRTLILSGKLRGAAGALKNNAVSVQASAGTSWRAVKTVRSKADGTWQVRYRVPRQLRGTYKFRAVVAPSAAYPYTAGRSSTRKIRVR